MIQKVVLVASLILMGSCSKPDFQDSNGNGVYLKELNQKWLIVNYWATWCGPCIREIPELNELSQEYSEELNLIGVDFDHPDPTELVAHMKKMKIEFRVLSTEPAEILNIEIPMILPTTYVFEPGGKLVKQLGGPQTKEGLLKLMGLDGDGERTEQF